MAGRKAKQPVWVAPGNGQYVFYDKGDMVLEEHAGLITNPAVLTQPKPEEQGTAGGDDQEQAGAQGAPADPDADPDADHPVPEGGGPRPMAEGDDPGDFTVEAVQEYLDDATDEEIERVLAAETDGKARKSILGS